MTSLVHEIHICTKCSALKMPSVFQESLDFVPVTDCSSSPNLQMFFRTVIKTGSFIPLYKQTKLNSSDIYSHVEAVFGLEITEKPEGLLHNCTGLCS